MGGREPTFLIVGVPKAGTGALASALGQHPDVYSHPLKELHYFDHQARQRDLSWYHEQFAKADDATAVGEATPTYALHDDWVAAASRALPHARIILQVRDPVERLWSSYWFFRIFGLEQRSLREVVEQDLSEIPANNMSVQHVSPGRYDDIYARVVRAWPESQVLVIDAAELQAAADEPVSRACEHIGVAPLPLDPGTGYNRVTMPRSERLQRILRAAYPRLPGRQMVWKLARMNLSNRRPPELEDDLRERLREYYEPHTQAFERQLGRRFSAWRV
ncbi:MAG TPA: sulfotransferase [Acidimicrobiia bacterium]